MSYDPGYGPPMSGPPQPGPPPMSGPPAPPYSGPPAPPYSGPPGPPPISGAPASPGFGPPVSPYAAPGMVPAVDPGPRPPVVTAAVALTFAGAALAFIGTLLFYLFTDTLLDIDPDAASTDDVVSPSGATTFMAAGFNLVGAATACVCAIFAVRGSNGARVVLCVLAGVFAMWKLACGGMWGFAAIGFSQEEVASIADATSYLWAAVVIDIVQLVLAATILVLLLVGPSNRYFTPPKVMATPMY